MTGLPPAEPAVPMGPAAEQAPRARRLRACRRRGVLHALGAVAVLLAVAVCFAIRFAALGLPEPWVDSLSEALSSDVYSVELAGVSFSLAPMELRVDEARVYAKGSVQKPVVRAAGARIRLRPRRSAPYAEWIREIRVRSVVAALPEDGLPETSAVPDGGTSFAVADFPAVPFSCRLSDVMGLRTHSVSGTISCRGGVLRVDGAGCDLHEPREARQHMDGSFECDTASLSIKSRGRGRLDPAKLDALLRAVGAPSVADEIAKFSFAAAPPEAEAVHVYDPEAGVRSLDIALRADAGGSYNGVPFSGAEARLRVSGTEDWAKLEVSGLRVRRPEGDARGDVEIDLADGTIRLDATSTMDPKRALVMIGALPNADDLPLDFDNPTDVRALGTFALRRGDGERTALSLRIASAGVSDPDLPGLRIDRIIADGCFTNGVFDLPFIRADALGGDADLSVRIALPSEDRPEAELHYSGTLRGVSHAAWRSLFGETVEGDEGRADATFSMDGPLADAVSMQPVRTTGSLDLDVHDVPVFRILFFSGLRDFLSRNLAAFDPLAEDRLQLRARMADGVIRIEDLRIEGGAISITGDGNVWTDGVVNLGVKVHLMNRRTWIGAGLYYLFSPFSSIFAVRATGPVDNPNWESEALFISGTDVKPRLPEKPSGGKDAP